MGNAPTTPDDAGMELQLRAALLAARERRQELLEQQLAAGAPCVVMLSLNLPGPQKTGERAERLFAWGERQLERFLPLTLKLRETDALGPFALYRGTISAELAKERTVALEASAAAGRLLDLDVYAPSGETVGRKELGLPARRCLVCADDAVICMRLRRHDAAQLQEKVHVIIDTV